MIAIKILNVMTKIGPIIKDKTNEEKGFDYASIASIIIRAREAMIEEKVIMIPLKLNQVVQKGNDVIIDMVYRFYDAEPNEDGKCDYMDVNIPGEGADKEGWAVYKALSGAYKYAITQTFAIPTIDDAEKDKYTTNNEESNNNDTVTENVDAEGSLDENSIDKILGDPDINDFDNIFSLGEKLIERFEKMYIKSINNVVGYKDLPDGFNIEFNENKTYIVGANFQRKTTVGSLFNWCLTGTSLNGKEKEQVANDTKRVSNVIVDITFVDNFGIEHRLIRDKGKEIHLTLDGKEIKQENLAQFYKNKDIFLVAHNPYYFWTLEPKEQKDLVRNILPIIDSEETFELLNEYEQQVIKEPIENLSSYTDARNADIDRLGKEYNKNIGKIETLRSIALEQEGCLLNLQENRS